MTKEEIIKLLNEDLRREYKHLHFYLHSASVIKGLHRQELRELLLEEAAGEMKHVSEFADLLVGLGSIPTSQPEAFPDDLTDAQDIIHYALQMEDEVVANYATRIGQAQELGGTDGHWIEVFLEDQLLQSRTDADNLRQMLTR